MKCTFCLLAYDNDVAAAVTMDGTSLCHAHALSVVANGPHIWRWSTGALAGAETVRALKDEVTIPAG